MAKLIDIFENTTGIKATGICTINCAVCNALKVNQFHIGGEYRVVYFHATICEHCADLEIINHPDNLK